MIRRFWVLIGVLAIVAASCAAGVDEVSSEDSADGAASTVSATPADEATDSPEVEDPSVKETRSTVPPLSVAREYEGKAYPTELEGLVGLAVTDAAARFGVPPEAIVVVAVEEVVWPNGGLGCPRPGMSYAQIPTDGLRIILEYSTTEYVYHSGGTVDPFLCEPVAAEAASAEPSDPDGASTDTTLVLEKSTPVDESEPTEEPGGPGGPPDE